MPACAQAGAPPEGDPKGQQQPNTVLHRPTWEPETHRPGAPVHLLPGSALLLAEGHAPALPAWLWQGHRAACTHKLPSRTCSSRAHLQSCGGGPLRRFHRSPGGPQARLLAWPSDTLRRQCEHTHTCARVCCAHTCVHPCGLVFCVLSCVCVHVCACGRMCAHWRLPPALGRDSRQG